MNDFKYYSKISKPGYVTEIKYPIVYVKGLTGVKLNEMVIFETGEIGEVFSVENNFSKIVLLSKSPVLINVKVVHTGELFTVAIAEKNKGEVIDPTGKTILNNKIDTKPQSYKQVDIKPLGLISRLRIQESLLTGTSLVDLLLPLGKGQRELIIGDRKTGKTAFILTAIKKQIPLGTYVVYAMIGKNKSDIKKIKDYFIKEGLMEKIIMVVSSLDDSPRMIYQTPYSAMTVAEYIRDKGHNVLLVLDDLSVHAKYYREISLVAGSFPGRDSYPGDIFYVHAKLLERAGNFKIKNNIVSITCLPIIETIEGDLTGYIPTNTMSMTDGHIFFDSNYYFKGQRPAINIGLSVTRVGRQTQSKLKREINQKLTAFINNYERMQNYSHFGGELSEKVINLLKRGEKLYQFFNQDYKIVVPDEAQIIIFALIWLDFFKDIESHIFEKIKMKIIHHELDKRHHHIFAELAASESLDELLNKVMEKKEDILTLCKI